MRNPYEPPRHFQDDRHRSDADEKRSYGTFIACGSIFVFDTFVANQGGIAILASFILIIVVLARIRRPLAGAKLCAVLALTPAVWITNAMQNRLARHRAETIIVAVEAYHADHHAYPKSLDELVPKYMPSVPRAKYTMFGDFDYWTNENGASLQYVALPPFGRPYYHFEDKRWGYTD